MKTEPSFKFKGTWKVDHFDVDGSHIGTYNFDNGIVTIGFNTLLNVVFGGASQSALWYIGLIDNAGFTALASTDTIASHPGWTESVIYSEAFRQQWVPTSATAQSITSNANAQFSINATGSIKGLFIVDNHTKSGGTGLLWSTGLFDSTKPVVNGQTFKCVYTLSAA